MANRCAVITGASRGIGRLTALELARHGWDVGLIARSEPELTTLAGEIHALGQRAYIYPQDMSEVTQLVPLMHRIAEDLGGCEVLVNNAGVAHLANLADTPLAEWQRIFGGEPDGGVSVHPRDFAHHARCPKGHHYQRGLHCRSTGISPVGGILRE